MGIPKINPKELTRDLYLQYCRMYLTQKICEVIPSTSPTNEYHVKCSIEGVDTVLFDHIDTETGKLILVNAIYQMFTYVTEEELSREYLYELVSNLAEVFMSADRSDWYAKKLTDEELDEFFTSLCGEDEVPAGFKISKYL